MTLNVLSMRFRFGFPVVAILIAILAPSVFAYQQDRYDLDLIELKVLDIQVLSMDDTPDYYFDDADLVKITINVTNNEFDYFTIHDKMFKIWVTKFDFNGNHQDEFEIIDNYYTVYDDELEVRYDNFPSRELFNECDYTNDRVKIGTPKVFTLCYDVLRIWNNNEALNLDGQKRYYLVMMDNHQATSCPNCKKILLSNEATKIKPQIPNWVQNLLEWYRQGIISDKEYQNSIEYLVSKEIISDSYVKEIQGPLALAEKNRVFKEHQDRLSLAQQTNLYVSAMNFYESMYSDNFSGVLCKKQNNIVTLSADYTNDDYYYDTIFFKLLLFDGFGNMLDSGISKIVDIAPKEYRHFSVSTPYKGDINQCQVIVDSKFTKGSE